MQNTSFELKDEALEEVSGGVGASVNIWTHTCNDFVCVWCGRKKQSSTETEHSCRPQGNAIFSHVCNECEHLYTCSKIR